MRIRVAYAALNPLDTHARAARIEWNAPSFPMTPGYEYSGLVERVGEGVGEEWLGRRVVSEAQLKNRIDAFFEGLASRKLQAGRRA